MKSLFLENNNEKRYLKNLADFYQYFSKNREIACNQACNFISLLNEKKRLVEFIKNKECQSFIRSYDRTNYLNVS